GESLRAAFRLLDEHRPEAAIGHGGFASVPLAIAARRRGVPLLLLEQNVVPGRATSWLSRWAERVCVSFEETRGVLPKRTPTLVTGNPVRRAITASGGRRRDARHTTDPPTLLVLGGSQGAAGVNATAVAALAGSERKDEWRIVHQTGERDASAVRAAYSDAGLSAEVAAYFPDLPSRYVEASLVVSRAGATTLAELACLGVPTILVPYPGALRDHQRKNAEHFASAGGALIVPEGPTAADRLRRVLDELSDAPDRLADMSRAMRALARPDAASAVADVFMPRAVMTRAA
ncbi:MAG TPA: UDP-N-acetylglucosamine--N-acetylmuramyl-(pentapeptide) pyrophosphoryl-undecaprenol N-acetylglucosamine transferase, partial [Planctomycetaceae bacterium]